VRGAVVGSKRRYPTTTPEAMDGCFLPVEGERAQPVAALAERLRGFVLELELGPRSVEAAILGGGAAEAFEPGADGAVGSCARLRTVPGRCRSKRSRRPRPPHFDHDARAGPGFIERVRPVEKPLGQHGEGLDSGVDP